MKKLLILTNVLWLCIFFITGFRPNAAPESPADNFRLVDASLVKTMIQNYRQNYFNTIKKDGLTQRDSRTLWLSLKKMESFVKELRAEAAKNQKKGAKDIQPSGIRFYLIQYPTDAKMWDQYAYLKTQVSPTYRGLQSLLMVPTYSDGKKEVDYDPRAVDANGNPVTIGKVFDKLIQTETPTSRRRPNTSRDSLFNGMNAMSSIPPPALGIIKPGGQEGGKGMTGATLMHYLDGN